jgi:ATP-dependent helicase/nuclease subunit A
LPVDAAARARAIDVHRSVIVQAPAGSGKTTLLVDRFLALLAIVERPEQIVAITFTRKAADEMRRRVVDALRSDTLLGRTIAARGAALNWQLEEHPARLRIQTIDSLATGLVRALPLGSRLGSNVRILEDPESIYREAIERVFARLHSNEPLLECLLGTLTLFDDDYPALQRAFSQMLASRDQWLDVAMLALRQASDADDANGAIRTDAIERAMRDGVEALHARVFADIEANLTAEQRQRLARAARYAATQLAYPWPWPELPDTLAGWLLIAELVSTRSGTPRRQFGSAQGLARSAEALAFKQQLKDLNVELAATGCLEQIHAIRALPDLNIDGAQAHTFSTVATTLALVVVELNTLFERGQCADFTELGFAAQRALGDPLEPTDVALALDYRIQHLLIDEFQDTSTLQFSLFARLLQGWTHDDGRTLFSVGDPMQSIYRFRDADVALFQRMRRDGIADIALDAVQLASNFRSSTAMVDWCNSIFGQAFGRSEDPTVGRVAFAAAVSNRPTRSDDGCRTCFIDLAQGATAEAACVVDAIVRIRQAHPGESIAVLVRNRSHLDDIVPALAALRIGWSGTEIALLADKPIVDDLHSLLRALLSDVDRLAWLALLRSPLVGLDLDDLTTLAGAADVSAQVRGGGLDTSLSAVGRRRLARVRPVLVRAHRLRAQLRTRQWLEHVFIDLGGADAYADEDALTHAERFFAVLERDHAWSVDLTGLARSMRRLFAMPPPRPDAVQLMTIHRAKGLEFDHVLVPGLNRVGRVDSPPVVLWRPEGHRLLLGVADESRNTIYTWLQREERLRDRHELVRLLYVAATRARYSLSLFGQLESRDGVVRPPPLRSLLGQVWDALPAAAKTITAVLETEPTTAQQPDLVLAEDYQWHPPTHTAVPLPWPGAVQPPVLPDQHPAVGQMIRDELRALSSCPPPQPASYVRSSRERWLNRLRLAGVGRAAGDYGVEIARQVELALAGHAPWLRARVREVEVAIGLTGLDRNVPVDVVVDLSYIDASGRRCIVLIDPAGRDPDASPDAFIAAQRERLGDHVRRVTQLASDYFGVPIHSFVYASAIPQLVDWTGALAFSRGDAENRAP